MAGHLDPGDAGGAGALDAVHAHSGSGDGELPIGVGELRDRAGAAIGRGLDRQVPSPVMRSFALPMTGVVTFVIGTTVASRHE